MATEERTERPGLEGPIGFSSTDGKTVPLGVLRSMHQSLLRLIELVSGRLSLGSGVHGAHSGRIDGQWLRIVTPANPGVSFAVPHGLGRKPIGYAIYGSEGQQPSLYNASDHDWDESLLWLASDTASVAILLHVV
jgi:hypothetical protein